MYYLIILLIVATLPAILVAKHLYKLDIDKEPKKVLKKIFFTSMVFTIIFVVPLEMFFENHISQYNEITVMLINIYGIGLIEEIFKFLPAYIFGIKSESYNSFYDAILYCTFGALGFACFENVLYVFDGGIVTGIYRAILCIPGHTLYGAIFGVFVGLATTKKLEGNNFLSIFYFIIGLLISGYMHGIYDYALTSGSSIIIFLSLALEAFLIVYTLRTINKLSKIDSFNIDTSLYMKYISTILISSITVIILVMGLSGNIISKKPIQYMDGKIKINQEFTSQDFKVLVNNYKEVEINGIEYIKVNLSITNKSNENLDNLINYTFSLRERESKDSKYNTILVQADDKLPTTLESEKSYSGSIYFEKAKMDTSKLRLIFVDCNDPLAETCETYLINLN